MAHKKRPTRDRFDSSEKYKKALAAWNGDHQKMLKEQVPPVSKDDLHKRIVAKGNERKEELGLIKKPNGNGKTKTKTNGNGNGKTKTNVNGNGKTKTNGNGANKNDLKIGSKVDPNIGSKLPKKFDQPGSKKTPAKPVKKRSTASSRMRAKNVARHGEKAVKHLENKNAAFQQMKKGKMTKAEFIKKFPNSITAQRAAGIRR